MTEKQGFRSKATGQKPSTWAGIQLSIGNNSTVSHQKLYPATHFRYQIIYITIQIYMEKSLIQAGEIKVVTLEGAHLKPLTIRWKKGSEGELENEDEKFRELSRAGKGFRSYGAEHTHEARGVNPEHCHSLFTWMETNSQNQSERRGKQASQGACTWIVFAERRFWVAQQGLQWTPQAHACS